MTKPIPDKVKLPSNIPTNSNTLRSRPAVVVPVRFSDRMKPHLAARRAVFLQIKVLVASADASVAEDGHRGSLSR
jgi:hypothetical protein